MTTAHDTIRNFFTEKIPKDWLAKGDIDVSIDNEEILVVLPIKGDAGEFRERTREQRMAIADEAQPAFNRTVSWGVQVGDQRKVFTSVAMPVMTRLRLPERSVLDTLVAAGVARSRADALGWCVRLVGKHEADWLKDLNDALSQVNQVRAEGPVAM